MLRVTLWGVGLTVLLFAGVLHAQGTFSIRAASEEAVTGWDRMQEPEEVKVVWVSPVIAVTSADIESARPVYGDDGRLIIAVTFTDAGAKKMHDLTVAQFNKLIALVLDGKVIWAPKVRSELSKEGVLSGNGPNGLTMDQVRRLMSSFQ
jgi:preprotein translocase subunit SecD